MLAERRDASRTTTRRRRSGPYKTLTETVINYDAIEQLIAHIIRVERAEDPPLSCPPVAEGAKDLGLGAVLVFMPGQFEITKLIRSWSSPGSSTPRTWASCACCPSTAPSPARTNARSSSDRLRAFARSSSPPTSPKRP